MATFIEMNVGSMRKTMNFLITIFGVYSISLLTLLLVHRSFPRKYFFDANTIRKFMQFSTELVPLNSYNNIAFFYKSLGFSPNEKLIYAGFFTFSLAYLTLVIDLFLGKKKLNEYFLFIFIGCSILMVIYLGQFSKEISALLLMSILLYFSKYPFKFFLPVLTLIITLYSYYFRIYWIIILYFLLIFYAFSSIRSKSRYLLIFMGIILVFIAANYKGIFLTDSRTNINVYRIGSVDAQTVILNPLKNRSFLTDFLNAFIILLSFFFPLSLLLKFKLKYLIFFTWEVVNFLLFLKVVFFTFKNKVYFPVYIKRRMIFAIFLIISFTFTQSLFEPDYGSFLKHQVDIIPMYLFLISNYFYFYRKFKWRLL